MSTEGNNGFTEEELAGLSDEERKAVLEPDEDIEVDEEVDEEEVAESEKEEGPEEEPEKETEQEPEKEEEPEPEEEAPAPEVEEPEPPAKVTMVELPAEQAEEFKSRLADAASRYENGDIENMADFLAERDAIRDEQKAAEAEAVERENAENEWKFAQNKFMTKNKAYLDDNERYQDLSACVQAVVAANKARSLDDALAIAKKMEEAMNGTFTEKPAAKQEEGVKTKPKSLKPKVPNISDIPAVAENDTSAKGEFDALDKLTGLAYEEALNSLSPNQLEKYLGE